MSESMEMYLVMTVLERKGSKPVPLSLLAEKLSISTVSANEMCHKMTERGLVDYQPYKGITLTNQGEALAQRVLARRNIWASFLVNHLGIEPHEADEIACQLEHITSDKLIEALSAYMRRPLPSSDAHTLTPTAQPLTRLTAGQSGRVVSTTSDEATSSFLKAQGIQAGTHITVLAVGSDGAMLLGLSAEQHISLACQVAGCVFVAAADQ